MTSVKAAFSPAVLQRGTRCSTPWSSTAPRYVNKSSVLRRVCVCFFLRRKRCHLCVLPLSPDHIRRGRPGLCQSAEEQIQDQALLRQTPTDGLPARADHPGRRQHGNVRHTFNILVRTPHWRNAFPSCLCLNLTMT